MRPATAGLVTALIVVITGGCGGSSDNGDVNAIVIEDVTVVDPERGEARPDQSVVILNGRVRQVAMASEVRALTGERVVDGRGKFLMPGLWDMHVHVAGDGSAVQQLLASGVVVARDMGGDFAALSERRRRVADGRMQGPLLLLAGPSLRGATGDADTSSDDAWVVRTADDARREVGRLASLGVDVVSVDGDIPRDAFFAIARDVRERRLTLGVRPPPDVRIAEIASAGAASLEGLAWLRDSPADLDALSRAGIWLTPMISAARASAPSAFDHTRAWLRTRMPDIRRANLRLLAGTGWDPRSLSHVGATSGSPPAWSIHDELMLLVDAGLTPAEALRAATSGAAEFAGMASSHGTIAAGRTADLLLLDADPLIDIRNTRRINAVIKGGRFLNR